MLSGSFDLLAEGLERLCRDGVMDRLISRRRSAMYTLLVQYIQDIEQYNPSLSLVGTNNRHELIVRHILDSLAPLGVISQLLGAGRTVADVGSGAGLPGIPLAIAWPDVAFTLIENKGRRAGFLRHTQKSLGLANVTVEEEEMEKVKPGRFNMVTFRAFKPLEPKLLKHLFRLCTPGGTLAAYKGRPEKVKLEMTALEKALPDMVGRWKLMPCPVPFLDEQRHLLIIK